MMKAKKIFLFVTCIVICILFAACGNESTPQTNDPQPRDPYEKMEGYGFKFAKSDAALPTMESLPEDAKRIANNQLTMVSDLILFGIATWDDEHALCKSLDAHPEYVPQIALMICEVRDCANSNLENVTPEMTADLAAFCENNGLWPVT